jgi:hypothetical protein
VGIRRNFKGKSINRQCLDGRPQKKEKKKTKKNHSKQLA